MKRKRYLLIIIILFFISIGFAILSSNLSLVSNISIAEASFDVHFDNVTINDTSIENDTYSYNDDKTEISFNIQLDKPGDYIDYKLYVVNGGTIDASLNSLNVIVPATVSDYVTCTLTYYDGDVPTTGDLLRLGTNKPLKLHIEYNYNIDNLIELDTITVTASLSYKQPQNVDKYVWNFDYEGAEQTFVVPKTGTYKIEVWGAQGGTVEIGSYTEIGGYGGYSYGNMSISKGTALYINVGEGGQFGNLSYSTGQYNINRGRRSYNGGGASSSNGNCKWAGGGGATHIAKMPGVLKDLESYKGTLVNNSYYSSSVILLVAGGGGGAGGCKENTTKRGGDGGGYIGNTGLNIISISGAVVTGSCADGGNGGTQVGAGDRGYGQNLGTFGFGGYGNGSGGGAGFYGGNGSWNCGSSAGGGSGYIGNSSLTSKSMYCYNCQESSDTNTKTISTTNVSETPTSNYAKIGNGSARITYIG